jgi:hypothetical protein
MLKIIKNLLGLVSLAVVCCSCSHVSEYCSQAADFYQYVSDFPYFSEPETNTLTLQIETVKSTNQGTPFYILLKSTDFAEFLREDYQNIASLVSLPSDDPNHLASICIIPGTTKTIKVKTFKDKSTAIYCLFTYPGEGWKYIIDTEEGPQKVKILLGEHEIKSINIL